jgi:branched-chain amino acid transport system permease protein
MHNQILVSGLAAGAAYGLVAVSFALICHTARFFHLAHAATYTVAAYLVLALLTALKFPDFLAIGLAIVGAGLLGCSMHLLVYRPLERRASPPAIMLLASLGILIVLQGTVSLLFGDATQSFGTSGAKLGFEILGARMTPVQALTLISGVLLTTLLWVWLQYSRSGMILRALANDRELSGIVGVDIDRMMLLVLALGSALGGLAAILSGYDTDLTPMMGFKAVLIGIVAAILGGMGSLPGAFFGGILIGLIQNFAAWFLPGQWQDTAIFAILVIVLVVRPQGLLNRPFR